VLVGLDTSGEGVLDADEVTDTLSSADLSGAACSF